MASKLPGIELARRAAAVLRNKVRFLEWYYFDVNLDERKDGDSEIFDRLEPDGTGYAWRERTLDATTIFAALRAALNEQPKSGKHAFRSIFDLDAIPNRSGAFSGLLGRLNAGEQANRARRLHRLLRDQECRERVVVLAEGDSWFQFPSVGLRRMRIDLLRDILDHLIDRRDVCVESIAAGGDWLSNMLHSRQYVDALSQLEPDVFLFSGGGNDLLGEGRAGNMVVHRRRTLNRLDACTVRARLLEKRTCQYRCDPHSFDRKRFMNGLRVLSDEFFQFLNVVSVQYFLFLLNLRKSQRFKEMLIVSQGYDYAVPRPKSTARRVSAQRLVNRLTKPGKWLWVPFEKKELSEPQKKDATYAMIMEFNEVLASIARSGRIGPVAHIDCRGLANSDADWYDEIHLSSRAFERVAKLYVLCIRDWLDPGRSLRQVYTTKDQKSAEEVWKKELPKRH